QRVPGRQIDSTRIDETERGPVPLAVDRLAVAGDPRLAVNHGFATPGEPVDERGLADVREAHDGDLGDPVAHRATSPRSRAMATIRSTTWSTSSSVVSSSIASAAGRSAPCSRSR